MFRQLTAYLTALSVVSTSFLFACGPQVGVTPTPITGYNSPYPDADDDTISDGAEDINKNGALDPGETDPHNADTDGDGESDSSERWYKSETFLGFVGAALVGTIGYFGFRPNNGWWRGEPIPGYSEDWSGDVLEFSVTRETLLALGISQGDYFATSGAQVTACGNTSKYLDGSRNLHEAQLGTNFQMVRSVHTSKITKKDNAGEFVEAEFIVQARQQMRNEVLPSGQTIRAHDYIIQDGYLRTEIWDISPASCLEGLFVKFKKKNGEEHLVRIKPSDFGWSHVNGSPDEFTTTEYLLYALQQDGNWGYQTILRGSDGRPLDPSSSGNLSVPMVFRSEKPLSCDPNLSQANNAYGKSSCPCSLYKQSGSEAGATVTPKEQTQCMEFTLNSPECQTAGCSFSTLINGKVDMRYSQKS